MWEELGTVDWAGLRHNYGSAEDVPSLLNRCAGADAEDAEDAVADLDNLLFHQGGWVCSAATAALPFLVRLAVGSGLPTRCALLDLLAQLASTSVQAAPKQVDPGWSPAWRRVLPEVMGLLADPEPVIRRGAAYLVGVGGWPSDSTLPVLLDAFRTEQDAVTRLDLVLSLGAVAELVPERREEALSLLHALVDSPEPQLRLAAVHALAGINPESSPRRVELAVAAVRDPGVELWQHSSWVDTRVLGVQLWTAKLFPERAVPYALGLLADHPDHEQRIGALAQAGGALSGSRSAVPALLPAIAARLSDPDTEVRYRAVDLLACLGQDARAHADEVADLLGDSAATHSGRETVADSALWALVRMNDSRCVPGLIERIGGSPSGFGPGAGAHVGRGLPYFPQLPSLGELLLQVGDHAEMLLPAVRHQLRRTVDGQLLSRFTEVLAAWGPVADAAVPELLDLLAQDGTWQTAATALGGIGSTGSGGEALLMAHARADGPGASLAAWAYARVGGDPGAALAVLGPAATEGRFPNPDLRRLADLGRHASGYADQLRAMAGRTEDPWVSVEAAHAFWAATGDVEAALPALTSAVQGLAGGTYYPVMLSAVRYLARMGSAARPVGAALCEVAGLDHRLHYFGSWRAFTEDEAIRDAVAELLVATG
jgi:hypothetical protein